MMPHSKLHKTKLKKNLLILALIFLWCALIWGITMVRIGEANAQEDAAKQTIYEPADPHGAFLEQRKDHLEDIDESHEKMIEQGTEHQEALKNNPETWWHERAGRQNQDTGADSQNLSQ